MRTQSVQADSATPLRVPGEDMRVRVCDLIEIPRKVRIFAVFSAYVYGLSRHQHFHLPLYLPLTHTNSASCSTFHHSSPIGPVSLSIPLSVGGMR